MEELLEIVAAGQAIAITGSFVPEIFRRPDITYVPITDADPCPLSLCTRADDHGLLVNLLRQSAQESRSRLEPH